MFCSGFSFSPGSGPGYHPALIPRTLHEAAPKPPWRRPSWQRFIRRPFEEFFKRYAQLAAEERGVEAFARLATETKAFDIVGPPLAESDPL